MYKYIFLCIIFYFINKQNYHYHHHHHHHHRHYHDNSRGYSSNIAISYCCFCLEFQQTSDQEVSITACRIQRPVQISPINPLNEMET